ncbi:outer membrane receptor for ferrienterochelin and colicins [Pedobacter cryoconitis]|uniref:TonB-dependent receptor n=1 Tax=Pedobacter cryoconitis TaxID=188932 RepID=UPI00160E7B1B|nr:TonB-dependent receptor [Pedobacter cryoconitis]MBB6273315.1 outer membrane receptor for ferrienterochelin and colicins [Pedobacter cryoconitis]
MMLLLTLFTITVKAQTKGILKGRVTDEKNNALSGASVLLEPDHRVAISDKNGGFELTRLYTGTYTIKITAVGFSPYTAETDIAPGHTKPLHIKLQTAENGLDQVNISTGHHNPDNLIDMVHSIMPSTVITRKTIEQMGSRRLDEVLKEQTGLAIVSDIGSGNRAVGLQMQGFDSGYTMIMIDGQPMVGRNSGNFDLSRITVSNIEKIEIIKGASSCLYGSEALAGVVNIVTRKNITHPQGLAALRYGSYNLVDATLEGETPFAGKKGSAYISANYYRTDGFNANPYLKEGKTAPPFDSYSLQGRGRYMLNEISTLNFNGRYTTRHSVNELNYGVRPSTDVMDERDLNGSLSLNNNFRNGLRLKTQYYLTRYQTEQDITDLNSGALIPGNRFTQYLHRAEVQATHELTKTLNLTGGIGGAYEHLNDVSYRGSKDMSNYFAYWQADWKTSDKIGITGGARYDYHNKYGSKINPSIGFRYTPIKDLTFKAAIGTGFKTPNFRQLYLVFTNLQTGYTVLGAEEFSREIQVLKDAGQISSIWPIASRVGQLKPERSVSYSTGFTFTAIKSVKLDVNVFYNDIKNFINSEQVATKTSGQQIFSYVNIARAYLTGTEISLNWAATRSLNINAGYQLLYAIDRGVIDSIKTGQGLYGQVYDTDKNEMRRSTRADYFGMANRSRHMANIKFTYEHEKSGLTGSFRVNYRSKYGFMEANRANNFIDNYDTFVRSFFLFNASVQKTFYRKHLSLQLTADNLLNYRDQLMPAQQGRTIVGGITWKFFKDQL